MSLTGEHLYQLVQAYAALGEHRTGTPVDHATLAWFATELGKRGARVDQVPYQFERYVAHCRLMADAAEVEALPLYYEAVGQVHSSRLHLAELAINASIPGNSTHLTSMRSSRAPGCRVPMRRSWPPQERAGVLSRSTALQGWAAVSPPCSSPVRHCNG